MNMLLQHTSDLTVLLSILAFTAVVLNGWGRLTARWLVLPEIQDNLTLEIWLGFFTVLIITEILHLFIPIDWRLSIGIALAGTYINYSCIKSSWRLSFISFKNALLVHPWVCVLFFAAIVGWCSRGMTTPTYYDTGLYYLSTIRWLNEYSIVPGLGNLHSRLAYNQSYFSFIALMNFSPFWGKGYAAGGLFIFFLSVATIFKAGLEKCPGGNWLITSMVWTIACHAIYISAPSPDFAVAFLQVVIFCLLVKMVSFQDRKNESPLWTISILVILCTIIVNIKLSAVMFGLSVLIISLPLIIQTAPPRTLIIKIIALCLLSSTTHFIRGYILSGAPLFPSTFAGAWNLDWSMPIEKIQSEADVICSWAHGGLSPEKFYGSHEWFSTWLKSMPIRGWLFCTLGILLTSANFLFHSKNKNLHYPNMMLIPFVASIIFWLLTAPDFRFLGAIPELFVIIPSWLLFYSLQPYLRSSNVFVLTTNNNISIITFAIATTLPILFVISLLKGISFSGWQKIPNPAKKYSITHSGLPVLRPIATDQCWNSPLPCTPNLNEDVRLRDSSMSINNLGRGFTVKPITSHP